MLGMLKLKAEIIGTKLLRMVPYLQIVLILCIICSPSHITDHVCPAGYSNACIVVRGKKDRRETSFVAVNEDGLMRACHGLTTGEQMVTIVAASETI